MINKIYKNLTLFVYLAIFILSCDARQPSTSDEEDANANRALPKKVEIPFTNYRMPVPEEEIMVTAATTAAISVAATLTATSLFKQCVKIFTPIIMQLAKRIQKKFTKNGDTTKEESSG